MPTVRVVAYRYKEPTNFGSGGRPDPKLFRFGGDFIHTFLTASAHESLVNIGGPWHDDVCGR